MGCWLFVCWPWHSVESLWEVERVSTQEPLDRSFSIRARSFAVAAALLAVFVFAGSGPGSAAEGDPTVLDTTTIVGDTTTTIVGDTTTTTVVVGGTTTTVATGTTTTTVATGTTTTIAGATTTTVVPTTTTTPAPTTTTTTTTIAPTPSCPVKPAPCLSVAMTAMPVEANGVLGTAENDLVEYVVDVTSNAAGPLTQAVLTLPVPLGVSNQFVFVSLNGGPITLDADGDASTATATALTVTLPSPLVPTRVVARLRIGNHIPLVGAAPTLTLEGSVRAIDLTQPEVVAAPVQYVPVDQAVADLKVSLTVSPQFWPTLDGVTQFSALVENQGPQAATPVTLTFDLPAVADLASVEPQPGCTLVGSRFVCQISKIDPLGKIPRDSKFKLKAGTLRRGASRCGRHRQQPRVRSDRWRSEHRQFRSFGRSPGRSWRVLCWVAVALDRWRGPSTVRCSRNQRRSNRSAQRRR